jgi:Ca-activated chloride channel family protein
MISFEYPWLLFLLLLAVPVALFFAIASRRRQERFKRFAAHSFIGRLVNGESAILRNSRFMLVFTGILIVLLTASGPRIRGGKELIQINGIDLIFAIDISNSMRAQDMQPDRLTFTQQEIKRLLEKSGNDRIGIVAFAGKAIPQLPLTSDKGSVIQVVESMTPDDISMQGTNIAEALKIASLSFSDKGRARAIVVISDGETHEGHATRIAAQLAKERNIIISTIGVGSPMGTRIPEFDKQGNRKGDKTDDDGQLVLTKLDESQLHEIAKWGKGTYVRATESDFGLIQTYANLKKLSTTPEYQERFASYHTLVPWLLIVAALLFFIEFLLPEGNRRIQTK